MFHFAAFELYPQTRILRCGETDIRLTSRLCDVLLAFLRRPGLTLTRADLLEAAWPGRVIEDGNIARAISSLRDQFRKAGATTDIIITVPGRGYRLTCPVHAAASPPPLLSAAPPPASPLAVVPLPASPPWRRRAAWIALAVLLCATLGGAAALALLRAPAPARVIAVLPFANVDGSPEGQRLAAGLPAALIDALGGARDIRVISQQTAFALGRSGLPVAVLGQKLGAEVIVRGALAWTQRTVELQAALIDAATGTEIWSRRFRHPSDDLLALQDELVGAVLQSLLRGKAASAHPPLAGGSTSAAAFDAYLRGMASRSEVDASANARAIGYFTEAVRQDQNFALAYAQRARALMYAAANGSAASRADAPALIARAREDARHAIALAPGLGIAHAALGYVLKLSLADLAEADAEYEQAVALMPGNTTVLMSKAFMDADLGRAALAVDEARTAVAFDSMSGSAHRMLAVVLGMTGHHGEAAAELQRAAGLAPADPAADRFYGARLAILRGDMAGAAARCQGERDEKDLWCMALVLHARGDQAGAQQRLAALQARLGDMGAFEYAEIYAQWGDAGAAEHWLLVAERTRSPSLIEMRSDTLLDPVRRTGGYQKVLAALQMPR